MPTTLPSCLECSSPRGRASGPPSGLYSPLVLPGFNEEEMLKDEAYEVPKKVPEVFSELGQVTVTKIEDDMTTVEDGTTIIKDGITIEETFSNLSPDL